MTCIVVDVLNFRHSAINDSAPPPVTRTPEQRAIVMIFACLLHSINNVFHTSSLSACVYMSMDARAVLWKESSRG